MKETAEREIERAVKNVKIHMKGRKKGPLSAVQSCLKTYTEVALRRINKSMRVRYLKRFRQN